MISFFYKYVIHVEFYLLNSIIYTMFCSLLITSSISSWLRTRSHLIVTTRLFPPFVGIQCLTVYFVEITELFRLSWSDGPMEIRTLKFLWVPMIHVPSQMTSASGQLNFHSQKNVLKVQLSTSLLLITALIYICLKYNILFKKQS